MALVDNTKVAAELNFGQRESSYPVYHYRNVYPANGASRIVSLTSAGAAQTTIFNVPAEQVNMGDSYLEYDLLVADQGDGDFVWIFKDVYGEYDSILYRDTGSQYLANIRNANLHNAVVSRLETSAEDLLYNDGKIGLVSANAAGSTAADNLRPDNTNINLMYKEPVNLQVGPAGNAAGTAGIVTIKRRVYLKYLAGKHTFLGMAKDSLFPQETYLEIGWIGNRTGYGRSSGIDPTNGVDNLGGNVGLLGGHVEIQNLVLKLAIQTNQDIIRKMKEEIAKGVTYPIPWTQVHTLMGNLGSQVTYNLTLDNKQHGQKIQRLIYVPFASALPAGAAMNTAYDHRNDYTVDAAGAVITDYKLATYNTELDNAKLQRDILNCANFDDYMVHKKILKNTTYFNQRIYNRYWVHIDAFNDPESNKNEDGSIYTDGYSLDKPTIWSVNKYSGTNAAIFNFAVVQGMKLLSIDSTSFVVK